MAREAGKGSGRRPSEVSKEVVDANWDRIFGKKNTEAGNQIEEKLDKSASEEIYDPHLTINS
jgi:hypothetical protein